jgi:uncharacterized membrane protein YdbT with pleckstrin-like domain
VTPLASASLLDADAGLPAGGLVVRPSLRAAVAVPFQFLGALAFATVFLLIILPGEAREPGAIAAFLLAEQLIGVLAVVAVSLAPLVRLAFTRYVFTDEALIVRTQVLSKTEQRVEWNKVTALWHRRTLTDRLLGIERIDVIAYGIRGATLRLVGLREAAPWRNLVARKMRASATVESLFAND